MFKVICMHTSEVTPDVHKQLYGSTFLSFSFSTTSLALSKFPRAPHFNLSTRKLELYLTFLCSALHVTSHVSRASDPEKNQKKQQHLLPSITPSPNGEKLSAPSVKLLPVGPYRCCCHCYRIAQRLGCEKTDRIKVRDFSARGRSFFFFYFSSQSQLLPEPSLPALSLQARRLARVQAQ